MDEHIHWIKVYETISNDQAEVLRAYLESNGIQVYLKGEVADDLFPGLDFTPVEIMVPQEQTGRANELIKAYLETEVEDEENTDNGD